LLIKPVAAIVNRLDGAPKSRTRCVDVTGCVKDGITHFDLHDPNATSNLDRDHWRPCDLLIIAVNNTTNEVF
jgi:hypothetical protein